MTVLITNEQEVIPVNIEFIEIQADQILADLDSSDKELSILMVDDSRIRELNLQYRDKDSATDVLSFPQFEEKDSATDVLSFPQLEEDEEPGFSGHLLGDVVLSIETAQIQAKEHNLSLEEELILLLIHGILHLLGYDHERSASEAEAMQKNRDSYLANCILDGSPPIPAAIEQAI